MLDGIRKKKDNFIYSFIILAVVAVMGMYGVGKMGGEDSSGGPAAVVNGEVITQKEFRNVLQNKLLQYQSMLGNQYDERLLSALQIPQKTLQELVQYKLLSQQAKKLGVVVPDQELADHIRSLPMYQKDGKFDAVLYSKLPDRGVEEHQRREMLATSKLQSYLADRVKMTPQELRRAILLKNTKVDLEYAKIDFNSLAPKAPGTPKQIEEFLKTTPEADLKAHYEGHKSEYTDKASHKIRQVRVAIPFKATPAQKEAAKKKIDSIKKEINQDNFETVAKSKSDDEHAKKGGNMGWLAQGSMEKPLEDAIKSLGVGQISEPIETTFGYFIVQVLEKKDEKVKPFEEVKNSIGQTLLAEKTKKSFTDEKVKAWEGLLAKGQSLDAELKKNKIEIKKTGSFSLGQGFIPSIGQVDSMVDAVFALTKEAPVAKRLFFYQDNYYYLKLKNLELPKHEEFEKSTEATEKTFATTLQGELMGGWLKELEKASTVKLQVAFDKAGPTEEM